ncbi:MAG: hypothetical protein Pg6C_13700 [Treponemataceae bacterium]|nr:MAG: hypothetical protein Pg6C_13700 [Treponemataceae bacterium]
MGVFRYDIHTHTKETSLCGKISAEDLVSQYIALNYNGIVITDHLHDEWVSSQASGSPSGKGGWNACVDAYLKGYRAAKEFASRISRGSFDVLFGIELRYPENENDYLIYGIDEQFLRDNPYPYRSSPREFFESHGSKTLIIQAHPFRDGCHPAPVRFLHGIEVFNGNPRHDNRNARSLALAQKNPQLLQTCASDTHQSGDAGRAAMLFDKRVTDSRGLLSELTRNTYTMETDRGEPHG